METVSEITKVKIGRPKSFRREATDALGNIAPDGVLRTKINFSLLAKFAGMVRESSEETQRIVWGCSGNEIRAGTGKFPPGFSTCSTEIGRYLDAIGDTEENKADVLRVVIDARQEKLEWREIKAYFRKLRLGERQGNAMALTLCLSRAFDAYLLDFPATTKEQQIGGVRNLLGILEDESATPNQERQTP